MSIVCVVSLAFETESLVFEAKARAQGPRFSLPRYAIMRLFSPVFFLVLFCFVSWFSLVIFVQGDFLLFLFLAS